MCVHIYIYIYMGVYMCIQREKKLKIRSIGRNSLENMFKVILKLKCITYLFKYIMRFLKK